MEFLDTRSRDVLMVLLQAQSPMAVWEIAEKLDITPRMMRSSLEAAQAWLEEREARLTRKPKVGVSIDAPDQVKESLIQELSQQRAFLLNLSPTERADLLILTLMQRGDEAQYIRQIEMSLGISRPTILKDIHKAEGWFKKYELAVIREPRGHIQIAGPESSRAEALVGFIIEKFGVIPLLSLGMGSNDKFDGGTASNLSVLSRMLFDLLLSLDLAFAYEQVKGLEKRLGRRFTDVSFAILMCHLGFALDRTAWGKTIEPWSSPDGLVLDGEEADAVCLMAEDIHTLRGIKLDPSEICFYTRQLLGAKVQRSLIELTRHSKPYDDQPEISEIVESIASEASLYLHPSLKVDRQLQRALYYHLQVAVNRLRYNLPIHNPLLRDIEAQYPQIFHVAQKSVGFFEKRVNRLIPKEEIASIAMHLAASMERLRPILGLKCRVWIVCGEGVDSACLLAARLQAEFPEVEVVEATSALEISQKPPEAGQVDAILATVPINIPGYLTLKVSPLLSHEDIARIHSALEIGPTHKIINRQPDEGQGPPLSALITGQTIKLGAAASSWEEVVEIAGGILRDTGAVHSRYIEAMKEVIWRYGPYVVFAPGVALLHARPEDGVNRLCMSLVTLKTPVPFGHPHHDPVSLAIVLGGIDNQSHLKALGQLAEVLSDPDRIQRIIQAPTAVDLVRLLSPDVGVAGLPTRS